MMCDVVVVLYVDDVVDLLVFCNLCGCDVV